MSFPYMSWVALSPPQVKSSDGVKCFNPLWYSSKRQHLWWKILSSSFLKRTVALQGVYFVGWFMSTGLPSLALTNLGFSFSPNSFSPQPTHYSIVKVLFLLLPYHNIPVNECQVFFNVFWYFFKFSIYSLEFSFIRLLSKTTSTPSIISSRTQN